MSFSGDVQIKLSTGKNERIDKLTNGMGIQDQFGQSIKIQKIITQNTISNMIQLSNDFKFNVSENQLFKCQYFNQQEENSFQIKWDSITQIYENNGKILTDQYILPQKQPIQIQTLVKDYTQRKMYKLQLEKENSSFYVNEILTMNQQ